MKVRPRVSEVDRKFCRANCTMYAQNEPGQCLAPRYWGVCVRNEGRERNECVWTVEEIEKMKKQR